MFQGDVFDIYSFMIWLLNFSILSEMKDVSFLESIRDLYAMVVQMGK